MSILNAVIISDIIIFIIKHPHNSDRNVMLDLCLIVLKGEPGRLCVGDRAGLPGVCVFLGNTSVVGPTDVGGDGSGGYFSAAAGRHVITL